MPNGLEITKTAIAILTVAGVNLADIDKFKE